MLQGDLDFQKGDEILITNKSHPDWWIGIRLADGTTGSLPALYVTPKVSYPCRPCNAGRPPARRRPAQEYAWPVCYIS
jgi:hypothetical protein